MNKGRGVNTREDIRRRRGKKQRSLIVDVVHVRVAQNVRNFWIGPDKLALKIALQEKNYNQRFFSGKRS